MSKISKLFKKMGFTFSFKRLRKAIILVIIFALIGAFVGFIYKFGSSESGLKIVYEKEISAFMDLGQSKVIKVHKTDINSDKIQDFVFIMGQEQRSNSDPLNSTIEMYNDVEFVMIDGATKQVVRYKTNSNYKPDVTLKISEDEQARYYLIYDTTGNVKLLKVNEAEVVDIKDEIIDITKNTTKGEFLGYTIYTKKEEKVIKVTLDNYNKPYLKEYTKEIQLDFGEAEVDLAKYRETYLRDKISNFEFKDVDNDGKLELVTTQNILYSLEDSTNTIGKVVIVFSIEDKKLSFKSVEIQK